MHSRIIQISHEPIAEEDYLDEYRYVDGFVGHIADYVSESDRASDIDWLENCLNGAIEVSKDKSFFWVTDKAKYFERKFEGFQEYARKLSGFTLEDFAGDGEAREWGESLDSVMWKLRSIYDDEYAFYVDDGDEYAGIETLDSFMRRAVNGDKYYLGATFDYHF